MMKFINKNDELYQSATHSFVSKMLDSMFLNKPAILKLLLGNISWLEKQGRIFIDLKGGVEIFLVEFKRHHSVSFGRG